MQGISLPLIRTEVLYHVGHLNPEYRVRKESLEADCLSASLCPQSWEMVARLGGSPTLILNLPGAFFINADAVDAQTLAMLIAEHVQGGFMEPVTWFKAWYWDGEADDWAYMACHTREAAEYQTEEYDLDDGPEGEIVEEKSGFRLTAAGASLLPRFPNDPILAEDAALLLYAKLRGADEGLSGVFWNDDDRPEMLLAPRYAILPCRFLDIRVTGPFGMLPFADYVERACSGSEAIALSDPEIGI